MRGQLRVCVCVCVCVCWLRGLLIPAGEMRGGGQKREKQGRRVGGFSLMEKKKKGSWAKMAS